MSLLCSTVCGVNNNVPQSYWDCADVTRTCGANNFLLIRCDYEFTDILDVTEWQNLIDNNIAHISPPGNFVPQAPTSTPFQVEGCGREFVGQVEYFFDFTTYQAADDLSDFAYWKNIFDNSTSYRLIPYDCNGIFTLDDDFVAAINAGAPAAVAGSNPGFEFSITVIPHQVEGEGDLCVWTTQFKVKKNGMLCTAFIPGLTAILS